MEAEEARPAAIQAASVENQALPRGLECCLERRPSQPATRSKAQNVRMNGAARNGNVVALLTDTAIAATIAASSGTQIHSAGS